MDKPISESVKRRERISAYARWGVALLAIVGVAWWLAGQTEKTVKAGDIMLSTVETGPLTTTINASGRVAPAHEQIVNSPVSSTLLRAFVHAGDTVTAGTPLIELDLSESETNYSKLVDKQAVNNQRLYQTQLANTTRLSDIEMQISVKEMAINRLRIEVDNERRLDSLGSGTGDRVRQAETALFTADLELKQLRTQLANERENAKAAEEVQRLEMHSFDKDMAMLRRTLDQGRIPAPIDGVVTYVASDAGSNISAGAKVAVVADLSSFRVEGEIAESDAQKVSVGAEATVRIGGVALPGMVSNINPQSRGGMVSIAITLKEPSHHRLQSGLRVHLEVSYGYKDNITLLANGQYFKGPGDYELFVFDGADRLVRRKVKLGDSNQSSVEVISGLSPGDRVVINNMADYKHSTSLKYVNN